MKYSNVGAGVLGTAAVGLLASLAFAVPLERDATSKALGDFSGRASRGRRLHTRTIAHSAMSLRLWRRPRRPRLKLRDRLLLLRNRKTTQLRSFSYQAAPQMGNAQVNRASARFHGIRMPSSRRRRILSVRHLPLHPA